MALFELAQRTHCGSVSGHLETALIPLHVPGVNRHTREPDKNCCHHGKSNRDEAFTLAIRDDRFIKHFVALLRHAKYWICWRTPIFVGILGSQYCISVFLRDRLSESLSP